MIMKYIFYNEQKNKCYFILILFDTEALIPDISPAYLFNSFLTSLTYKKTNV